MRQRRVAAVTMIKNIYLEWSEIMRVDQEPVVDAVTHKNVVLVIDQNSGGLVEVFGGGSEVSVNPHLLGLEVHSDQSVIALVSDNHLLIVTGEEPDLGRLDLE